MAAVQSVRPSPAAPYRVMGKSRAGKIGTLMPATMASVRAQGSAARAGAHRPGTSSEAVHRPEAARNERRVTWHGGGAGTGPPPPCPAGFRGRPPPPPDGP